MARIDVVSQAVKQCMEELYSLAVPKVSYQDFLKENKEFIKKEKEYYELPQEERPPYREYMGPKPYEFYFLPKDIMKDVCDRYISDYKLDTQQELLDTIDILKRYCKEPIEDKWIEGEGEDPGHRGYEHPDNLEKEIYKYLDSKFTGVEFINAEELQNKFFEFLDKAGKFFSWNRDLNTFNMNVYLGASPHSVKETVIENWKKYRGKDIEINEEQINKDYYGEEDDDY